MVGKLINTGFFRTTTINNNLSKTHFGVYDDGVTVIKQRILADQSEGHFECQGFRLLRKFKNWNYWEVSIGFKLRSLCTLSKIAVDTLKHNNIPPSNIK